jgi:hypothetical protein
MTISNGEHAAAGCATTFAPNAAASRKTEFLDIILLATFCCLQDVKNSCVATRENIRRSRRHLLS